MEWKQIYSTEQIDAFLNGIDVQKNWLISSMLGELGQEAVCYLPRLFELVREYYPRIPDTDIRTVKVVAYGSRSLGTLVRCVGYKPSFHDSILSWLLDLSDNPLPLLAELAVIGLGDFGVPPDTVRTRLFDIANGPLRYDEPKHATIRSVAFKNLARISRTDAELLRDSPAAMEYLQSVDNWIRELVEAGRDGNWAHVMHVEESAWLRTKTIP